MKTNNPHEEQEALNEILRTWRMDAPLPPHFRDSVWRRIEQEEAKSGFRVWAGLTAWIESVLPRPKIALCYVTALLLMGMASGMWMARQESDRTDAALGSRYVQSVDPYQAVASNR
jgi:hypothetical protein